MTYYLAAPPFSLGTAALSSVFVVYLVGAVATPLGGRLIGRIGPRPVLTMALGLGAAGALCTLLPSLAAVVVGLTLCSTAVFVSQSASTSHLQAAAPAQLRSLASGVYLSCYYVGGAVGGVLPAAVWRFGGWRACVALVVAFQAATLVLARRFWKAPGAAPAGNRPGLAQESLAVASEPRAAEP
jgi:MFS family permease